MKTFCLLATTVLSASVVFAQGRGPQQQAPGQPAEAAPANRVWHGPAAEEKSSVTHHKAQVGGQEVSYTATAATYIIRNDEGEPKATFFFVSYVKDDVADPSKRPLSFVYNGGPGSGSLFTHMGLGPKRIALSDDGHGMAAPYSIVDNNDSFLDATDMVFIDAVSTGYSRAAGPECDAILRDRAGRHHFLGLHLSIRHPQSALGVS